MNKVLIIAGFALLVSCSKTYMIEVALEERLDMGGCGEREQRELEKFLDTVRWRDTVNQYFSENYGKKSKQALQVTFKVDDSLVAMRMDGKVADGWAGVAENSLMEIKGSVRNRISDCYFRVNRSVQSGVNPAPYPAEGRGKWDSLPREEKKRNWFIEIGSPEATSKVGLSYGWGGDFGYDPDPADFENRYKHDSTVILAIYFITIPVVHPVYHTMVFRQDGDSVRAVYSRFKDGRFLWKADIALGPKDFSRISQEVDFLEKANTSLLGKSDYVDPVIQQNCRNQYRIDTMTQAKQIKRYQGFCSDLRMYGVVVNNLKPATVYLYWIRNLSLHKHHYVMDDFRIGFIRNVLGALPAGVIVYARQ